MRTLRAPSTKKKSWFACFFLVSNEPTVSDYTAVDDSSKNGFDITLLQKLQLILQKQCDALVSLGYDKSVKVHHILDGVNPSVTPSLSL